MMNVIQHERLKGNIGQYDICKLQNQPYSAMMHEWNTEMPFAAITESLEQHRFITGVRRTQSFVLPAIH
jgi:hypothetical protein